MTSILSTTNELDEQERRDEQREIAKAEIDGVLEDPEVPIDEKFRHYRVRTDLEREGSA